MQNTHSLEDLLDFLNHAGERGLMPAATAQALAVATRNVFAVLAEEEKTDLPLDDLDGIIRRFNNKRASDFNPASLKEYDRRVRRAVDMYQQWKHDPANFTVPTRATTVAKRKDGSNGLATPPVTSIANEELPSVAAPSQSSALTVEMSGYQTALPVRAGHVVTVSNIPLDLTAAEAERLAQFVRMLATN